MTDTDTTEAPPRAPLEYRSAELVGVDFPQRTITLVAMPYDQEALVEVGGRVIRESCAPGAYAGVEKRVNRVKVNRDHNRERHVGRAVALHPSRSEGLVTDLRISRTSLGDETLILAEDGDLEPSVEFAVMPGGEVWTENRSKRRLTRLYLAAISLVPEGAYGEVGGQVLAVRSAWGPQFAESLNKLPAVSATPNLDRLRLRQLCEKFGVQSPV